MPMCVRNVEAGDRPLVSPCILRQDYPLGVESADSSDGARMLANPRFPVFTTRTTALASSFYVSAEGQIQVLMFAWQVLYSLSDLLSLSTD